jgi:hypothetical protein
MQLFLDPCSGQPLAISPPKTWAFSVPSSARSSPPPAGRRGSSRDSARDFALQRIRDWIFYGGAEIVAEDQIGPRRRRRVCALDPALGCLSSSEFG